MEQVNLIKPNTVLYFTITEEEVGSRLDIFLSKKLPNIGGIEYINK